MYRAIVEHDENYRAAVTSSPIDNALVVLYRLLQLMCTKMTTAELFSVVHVAV